MKKVKRYQLVVNQREKKVNILEDKDFLATIDLYTMPYQNEKDFLYHHQDFLKTNGITDLKNCSVSVEYNQNKKVQALDPAFEEEKYLRQFAEGSDSILNDEEKERFSDQVLAKIGDGVQARILLDREVFDEHIHKNVHDYLYYNNKYCLTFIKKGLTYYKTARRFLTEIKKQEKISGRTLFEYPFKEYEEDLEKPYVTQDQASIFDLGVEEPKVIKHHNRRLF